MLRSPTRLKLYVVHGWHPCAAVEKARSLKGLDHGVIEWPPPMQEPMQRLIFGKRTVPGLRISDNGSSEKISGSQWGDEVLQPIARELIWAAMV